MARRGASRRGGKDHSALDKQWRDRRPDSPFKDAASERIGRELATSISVEDLQAGLDFLASITIDPAFENAARVLRAYKLDDTGLKDALRRHLAGIGQTVDQHAATLVDAALGGVAAAARQIAAETGFPGASLESAAKGISRQVTMRANRAPRDGAHGDTGQRLRVRLARGFAPNEGDAPTEFGTHFDHAGVGLVPDNFIWRWMIEQGNAELLGRQR